jgi:dinuclear metal center YbgI/SA1388 family protein
MEILTASIVQFCDSYVNREAVADYSGAFNGLQFGNSGKVSCIGSAVDASLESIQMAVQQGVDFLIVHHGLFWGTPAPITGSRAQKYRLLMEQGIAVYSSHLPLDAHPIVGNNASIAALLGQEVQSWALLHSDCLYPVAAVIDWSSSRASLKNQLQALFKNSICLEFGPEEIDQVVILSGGGGKSIAGLRKKGYHTLITGEGAQHHYALAQEEALNIYFCGHYATEVFGVQNLAKRVAEEFGLPYCFLPTACPL